MVDSGLFVICKSYWRSKVICVYTPRFAISGRDVAEEGFKWLKLLCPESPPGDMGGV